MSGLLPTYNAVSEGRTVALANKETLVAGGALICDMLRKTGAQLIPVDSEHSAIFQCMKGYRKDQVERILLTASGGPFRGKTAQELKSVTLAEALNHPRWKMGNKITIDSATLMNKGFEVIEARWLFGLDGTGSMSSSTRRVSYIPWWNTATELLWHSWAFRIWRFPSALLWNIRTV